jgi:hypothetical protein
VKKIAVAVITIALLVSSTILISAVYAKSGVKERPFKATGKGSAVALSGPPILEIVVTGSGHSTHMGKVDIWQHHFVNIITMTFYDGTFVWTASNGDKIEGSYYGSLIPTSAGFEIYGSFTIDGGTGRFAGASGGGGASGMQYNDNTAELELDGTISYGL